MRRIVYLFAVSMFIFSSNYVWADAKSEIEDLRHRVEELEKG